jgi:NAD(P)H-hydrate epimerase
MATGGMGDVLAGLIGSLLGQGYPHLEAASLGVYLHALAGDLAATELGPWGLTPRDVAERLPRALAAVLRGHEDVETLR